MPEQKPLGLSERRLPTNEQARPVPLMYGKQRLGVTYLSQAFNQKAVAVTQEVGKKSEPVTTGYNYYADFAALVCHGPVDSIEEIYFDGERVWPDEGDSGIERDGTNPVYAPITITGFGTWKLYWGTESQTIDSQLATLWHESDTALQLERHPAYVGQCYLVANQQFFGYQKTNVQMIEVVVTRYPAAHFNTGGSTASWAGTADLSSDCNTAVAIVDALVDSRYGLGLRDAGSSDTRLDRAGIVTVANQLASDGYGISPVVDRQQSFLQVLIGWLEYHNGFATQTTGGLFSLGLIRTPADWSAVPDLDEDCLTEPPTLRNTGWANITTQTAVKFSNRENGYKEDAAIYISQAGALHAGESSTTTLDRMALTRPDVADQLAQVHGKILAQPKIDGRLRVRASQLQSIGVGSAFHLHWDHWGLCNLRCRCQAITEPDPFKPELEIEFEADRGDLVRAGYTAPTYSAPVRIINESPVIDPDTIRVIELPFDRTLSEAVRIGFLVGRPSTMATQWIASYQNPDGSYRAVKSSGLWAFHGTLNADYSASASGQIDLLISGVDVASAFPNPDSSQAAQDEYLLIIESADGEDEILSVHTRDVVSSTRVKYSVLRERMDSAKRAHTAGDRWWLMYAPSIAATRWTHDGNKDDGETSTFKLQSVVLGRASAIADATAVTVDLTDRAKRPWKPKAVASSQTQFNAATTITFSWTRSDRRGENHSSTSWDGPGWVVEVRKASEAVGGASTEILATKLWENTSHTTTGQIIKSALGLGTLEDVTVRIYAKSGSYESRGDDEFTLEYVP